MGLGDCETLDLKFRNYLIIWGVKSSGNTDKVFPGLFCVVPLQENCIFCSSGFMRQENYDKIVIVIK